MNRVLLKYICNEVNEADALVVESRISSDPKYREYYQKLKDIYENKNLAEKAFRKEKSWDVVKDKAFADNYSKPKKKAILAPIVHKLAASVSFFIPFGLTSKAGLNTQQGNRRIDGLTTFDNEPFKDIATKLERYYGVQIFYHAEIGEKTFSGTFDRNESLEFMLEWFQLAEPITYQISGNSVYITKNTIAQTNFKY